MHVTKASNNSTSEELQLGKDNATDYDSDEILQTPNEQSDEDLEDYFWWKWLGYKNSLNATGRQGFQNVFKQVPGQTA